MTSSSPGRPTPTFFAVDEFGRHHVVRHHQYLGSNDPSSISGTSIGPVTEAGGVGKHGGGTPTATGALTDTDIDNPANTFTAVGTATASGPRLRHLDRDVGRRPGPTISITTILQCRRSTPVRR